jgi:hypothetical protein
MVRRRAHPSKSLKKPAAPFALYKFHLLLVEDLAHRALCQVGGPHVLSRVYVRGHGGGMASQQPPRPQVVGAFSHGRLDATLAV